MSDRPSSSRNILILGPGQHREFGLASLRRVGHRVGVVEDLSYFCPELADWYLPYPPAALRDPRAEIARSGIAWDVALAWGEFSLEQSLGVARELGLRCASLDVACFRDKAVMRERQVAAGLLAPDFMVVDDVTPALAWAGGRRSQVIVKPVDYGGSSGVRLASTGSEVEAAVRHALTKSFSSRAILETVIDGPEYSVETATASWRSS
jgi:hypothetical protein